MQKKGYDNMRGVYIHIPFCKTICTYCDFCKMNYEQKWSKKYLKQLKEEITDFYLEDEIKSIYIGGGTPSCLSIKEMAYLMELTKIFNKSKNVEFTLECNIEDMNEELLNLLKKYGVNRLSIGIQTFEERFIHFLGRNHSYKKVKEKMELIRKFSCFQVNLDLIYAMPKQTIKDLKKDLRKFLSLNPDHISTYSLMIEPHTFLNTIPLAKIKEETDLQMYKWICKKLKRRKYFHYEVSNFAKDGCVSIHNLGYWNNEEYYGFGLGSSGYIDGIRYTNTKNILDYINGNRRRTQEILTKKDILDNEVMLGLRKMDGIDTIWFEKKYGVKIEEIYPIKPLLKNGDLKMKNGYLFIPIEKIYIMNEILLKMI